ncbi:UNVERIFIED_CONTAM: Coiled-coil domain-containing protein 86 [Gekko kuhli]
MWPGEGRGSPEAEQAATLPPLGAGGGGGAPAWVAAGPGRLQGGKRQEAAAAATPRGRPKSGRVWKDPRKKRFSHMIQDKPLHSSWEHKMKKRQEKKAVKDFVRHLEEEKRRQHEEKKQRREENLRRRLENERKAEIVQVIRNPLKLKRAKKKQLRRIEKRDTLSLLQKHQAQRKAAKE